MPAQTVHEHRRQHLLQQTYRHLAEAYPAYDGCGVPGRPIYAPVGRALSLGERVAARLVRALVEAGCVEPATYRPLREPGAEVAEEVEVAPVAPKREAESELCEEEEEEPTTFAMLPAKSCVNCQHRVRDSRYPCIGNDHPLAGRYVDRRCARWVEVGR